MQKEASSRRQRVVFWLKVLAPVLLSLIGLIALRLLGPDFINQKDLHAWLAPMGRWAPLVFVLFLAVRPFFLLPGQALTALGGMVFGTLWGTSLSLMGSLLASAALFWVARRFGTRLMRRLAGDRYASLAHAAKRHDFQFAFLSCINPLVPTDVMLAAAASSGARFWPSVLGALVGTIPGTYLTAQFGSGLAQGRTVMTVVSGVGLVLSLILGGFLGRKLYREMNEASPAQPTSPPPEQEILSSSCEAPKASVAMAP